MYDVGEVPTMKLRYSDVTPRHIYLNRRRFLAAAAGSALAAPFSAYAGTKLPNIIKSGYNVGSEAVR